MFTTRHILTLAALLLFLATTVFPAMDQIALSSGSGADIHTFLLIWKALVFTITAPIALALSALLSGGLRRVGVETKGE